MDKTLNPKLLTLKPKPSTQKSVLQSLYVTHFSTKPFFQNCDWQEPLTLKPKPLTKKSVLQSLCVTRFGTKLISENRD